MPLFLLANWKWIASASIAVILTWYATSLSYRVTISHMEKEQAENVADGYRATLAMFTADADKVHQAAEQYTTFQTNLDSRFNTISKDFHDAVKTKPLSPDCRPDPVRVRSLTAAVEAANSAAGRQPGPAVPPAQ
jgi:hypothetical protein